MSKTPTAPTRVRPPRTAALSQPGIGLLTRAYRPPADMLPASLAPLAAELDALEIRHAQAQRDRLRLSGPHFNAAVHAARLEDAKAAATAAREGKKANPTERADALAAEADRARADEQAIAAAMAQVHTDSHEARAAEGRNPEHAAALAAARERLYAAADELESAARAAVAQLALCEWLTDGVPFDGAVTISPLDLAPIASQIGPRSLDITPAPIAGTVAALRNLAG